MWLRRIGKSKAGRLTHLAVAAVLVLAGYRQWSGSEPAESPASLEALEDRARSARERADRWEELLGTTRRTVDQLGLRSNRWAETVVDSVKREYEEHVKESAMHQIDLRLRQQGKERPGPEEEPQADEVEGSAEEE